MEEKGYSGYDALRIALEMERKGCGFYNSLAKKVSSRSLKEIFGQLAREEEYHIKTVEEKILPHCESEEAYWADEELMVDHLNRLTAGGVFPDEGPVLKRLEQSGGELEALPLAIQAERDSVALYSKAREAAADKGAKSVFGSLVEEEERHLQLLYYWQKELTEHGGG
jgi:rubrerythrin